MRFIKASISLTVLLLAMIGAVSVLWIVIYGVLTFLGV